MAFNFTFDNRAQLILMLWYGGDTDCSSNPLLPSLDQLGFEGSFDLFGYIAKITIQDIIWKLTKNK